ncbi:hypothetical protein ACHAWF_008285 [Thalassiosira exigua]
MFCANIFRVSLLLNLLLLCRVLPAGSAGTSCNGEDAACAGDQREPDIFDLFSGWIDDRSSEGQKFLEKILGPRGDDDDDKESNSFFDEIKDALVGETTDDNYVEAKIWKGISSLKEAMDDSVGHWFSAFDSQRVISNEERSKNPAFDFVAFFQTVFSASNAEEANEESSKLASEFIQKAADLSKLLQSDKTDRGFFELHEVMMKALKQVTETVLRNFGNIDWHRLKPFSLVYFLEYMESMLTPSWKRRAHAFAPEVSVKEVKELHKALYLANLAYLDTVDEIKAGLQEESSDWELIYAQLKNAPGEPAHYIALRKDHSPSFVQHDFLDVLLVVRGTKDFSDVLSDGLLDAVDFRGGHVHAGLAKSGQFLVDQHVDLLYSLLKIARKEKVKLTLIGHSLGAGAASIAALIFNEDKDGIDANVVGFGCPALLSKELSESTKSYTTTIVSDSDMIPRLSGPTLINAAFDTMSYDWIEKGLADLRNVLQWTRTKMPFDIPVEHVESAYDYIKKLLDQYVKVEIDEMAEAARETVLLMPPGSCIHFYRDGTGVTGQKMPCDFFDSLEISRTMIDDHLIGVGYNRLLLDFMRRRVENYQFTFEQHIV